MLYFYTECSTKLIDVQSRILSFTLSVIWTSIQHSGTDDAWIEAEVYGPSKQEDYYVYTPQEITPCTHLYLYGTI